MAPREKTSRNKRIRLRPADDAALTALAAALELDQSQTIRFLIHQKTRDLGLDVVLERAARAPADPPLPPDAEPGETPPPARAARKGRAR